MKKSKILPAILGAAILTPAIVAPYNTFAVSKTTNIKASIPGSLSLTLSTDNISLDLSDGDFHKDSVTVTGSTNDAAGYTISFNANNDYNDLKHSNTKVESLIPSITEDKTEATFPETAWGFSTDETNFKQVPLTAENIFRTAQQGQNSHTFTAGAKASANTIAGDYENELIFTIVANVADNPTTGDCNPNATNINNAICLQDMNDRVKATMDTDQQYQLKDARDGKIYFISKLRDDNVWMTQNLDYDLSVEANQTLTPETSNVTENRTIVPTNTELLDWGYGDNEATRYLDGGDSYYADGKTLTEGYSSLAINDPNRHYARGDYYSWSTAVANQFDLSSMPFEATESICPAGWRLPDSGAPTTEYSFGNLIKHYGYSGEDQFNEATDAALLASPLFFVRSGGINTKYFIENNGNYWSSLFYNGPHNFDFSETYNIGPNFRGSIWQGMTIRCVAL